MTETSQTKGINTKLSYDLRVLFGIAAVSEEYAVGRMPKGQGPSGMSDGPTYSEPKFSELGVSRLVDQCLVSIRTLKVMRQQNEVSEF